MIREAQLIEFVEHRADTAVHALDQTRVGGILMSDQPWSLCLFREVVQIVGTRLNRPMARRVRHIEKERLTGVVVCPILKERVDTLSHVVAQIVLPRRQHGARLVPAWCGRSVCSERPMITGATAVKVGQHLVKAVVFRAMTFVIVTAHMPFADERRVISM